MNQFLIKGDRKSQFDDTDFLKYLLEEQDDKEGNFSVDDYLNRREETLPDVEIIKDFMREKGNHDTVCQRCQLISSGKLEEASKIKVSVNSKLDGRKNV